MSLKQNRKGDVPWWIWVILGLIVAGVFIFAFIVPSGGLGKDVIGKVGSCRDPIAGTPGECDCFFDGSCPPGTTASSINRNCPKALCTSKADYIQKSAKAQTDFEQQAEQLEESLDRDLTRDQLSALEAEYFGRCCKGANVDDAAAPTSS
jgi:hypothetical protein